MCSNKSDQKNWEEYSYETRVIHIGNDPEQWDSLAVVPPIVLSSTFKQREPTAFNQLSSTDEEGYEYGRCGNPSRMTLERSLAPLEKARYALAFSSGMSAITSLIYLLKSGDHMITIDDVYSGANIFFRKYASKMNIEVDFVNMLDLELTEKSFKPNTAMVWLEPTTNPTLKMTDIKAVCEMAKKKNPNILIGVDNTFSSPYFLNPLELGADIVMHSVTKYLGGHSDVIMGAIMVNKLDLYEKIKDLQIVLGGVPSPFDCFLVCRSLKTFALRMEKHKLNGNKIALALENNPRVERVIYPGLKSHPQHELYKRQMSGYGGMMSFYIKTNEDGTKKFLKHLKIIKLAVSLGGFESLIEHPAIMTHREVPAAQREKLGIKDNFLRMSIGLEDADDLIKDLDEALKKAIPQI